MGSLSGGGIFPPSLARTPTGPWFEQSAIGSPTIEIRSLARGDCLCYTTATTRFVKSCSAERRNQKALTPPNSGDAFTPPIIAHARVGLLRMSRLACSPEAISVHQGTSSNAGKTPENTRRWSNAWKNKVRSD